MTQTQKEDKKNTKEKDTKETKNTKEKEEEEETGATCRRMAAVQRWQGRPPSPPPPHCLLRDYGASGVRGRRARR